MRPKIGLWWDTGLQPYHWRPYMCSETTQQWKNDGSRPCITRHYKTILTQFILRARLPTPYLGAKIPDCTIRFDLRQWKQSLKYRLHSESLLPGIYAQIWSPVPSSDIMPCLPCSVSKIRSNFASVTILLIVIYSDARCHITPLNSDCLRCEQRLASAVFKDSLENFNSIYTPLCSDQFVPYGSTGGTLITCTISWTLTSFISFCCHSIASRWLCLRLIVLCTYSMTALFAHASRLYSRIITY